MGGAQSHPNGTPDAAAGVETKTSYYDLLGITRAATDDEIKKAFRKKALLLHPDRNFGDVERATQEFTVIQSAYEVLSDPQERAWYDSHEDAILAGYDPNDPGHGAGGDDGEYERNVGLTSTDDIVRIMGRFNRGVDFSDAPTGFYGFLRETFEKLAKEEHVAAYREGLDAVEYPSFGRKDDGHEDVVKVFYGMWAGFSTRKTFAWRDKYRASDGGDRRERRYVEKANQVARNEGIREFNDAVRSLVAFVRKRDPRFKANTQSEEEREKALREATAARAAKQRAENTKMMDKEVLPEWAKHREPDEVEEEDDEESEEEQFECVACRKTFKSENQFEAHEKSKKHVKAVQALRKKMMKEGISLDISEDEEQDMADESEYPVVEDPIGGARLGDDADAPHSDELEGAVEDLDISNETPSRGPAIEDSAEEAAPLPQPEPTAHSSAADSGSSEAGGDDDPEVDANGFSSANETPLSVSPPPEHTHQPKLGKAAQKRAKRAAQATAVEESDLQHKCASCQAAFPSKTRLHQHIKDHPGHAAPVPLAKKGKAKGKRK
jgi:DnaJ family protein A protein 5